LAGTGHPHPLPPRAAGSRDPAIDAVRIGGFMYRHFSVRQFLPALLVTAAAAATASPAAAQDNIVLRASDAPPIAGTWTLASSSSGAGGQKMPAPGAGWSSVDTARASPADAFELAFEATAGTPYQIWLRLRA